MAASVAERDEVAAYDSMEAALKILNNFSSAPRLQTEISDALEVRGVLHFKVHKTVFTLLEADDGPCCQWCCLENSVETCSIQQAVSGTTASVISYQPVLAIRHRPFSVALHACKLCGTTIRDWPNASTTASWHRVKRYANRYPPRKPLHLALDSLHLLISSQDITTAFNS